MQACRLAARIAVGLVFSALPAIHGACAAEAQKSGSGKIIKWVDDKGITHYGDSLPAQESARSNSVINSQGVTVRKNIPVPVQPGNTAPTSEQQEQARHDKALLASYTTEQEIDLARDRNLQMDESALESLRQRRSTVAAQLNDLQQAANATKARKSPVPQDMARDINAKTAELGRIDSQIKQRLNNMQATRKRFDQEKQRFIELKYGTTAEAPPP